MFFPAKKYKSGKGRPLRIVRLSRIRNLKSLARITRKSEMIRLIFYRAYHACSNGIVIDFINDNKATRGMIALIGVAHQRLLHF